jgi:hypothetical protein
MSSFTAGADLRLRLKSTCATGVGLGATLASTLCHQRLCATRVGLGAIGVDFVPLEWA